MNTAHFPTTWAQFYALCYGELDHVLEDFLDGVLSPRDLRQVYNELHEKHFYLLREMVKRTPKGDPTGVNEAAIERLAPVVRSTESGSTP